MDATTDGKTQLDLALERVRADLDQTEGVPVARFGSAF